MTTTLFSVLARSQATNHAALDRGISSLSQVAAALAVEEAKLTEVALTPGEFHFNEEGLVHCGRVFKIGDGVLGRLCRKAHAPRPYLAQFQPQFQAAILSEHAKRGDFGTRPIAVLDRDELITIADRDDGLVNLTGSAVVRAGAVELGREGEQLFFEKIEHNSERLEINFVSPVKTVDVRVGDTIRAGISIIHWRYGFAATQIQAFIFRPVCSNGMVRRECVAGDVIPRTRRLSVDDPAARDLQMAQVRGLVRLTWNGLQARLNAIKDTSKQPVKTEDLLRRWLERAHLSKRKLIPTLMAAWRDEGAESTRYGVVNAVTRVATHNHDLEERYRRALASLGGLLAFEEFHICERCGSISMHPTNGASRVESREEGTE